MSFVRAGGVIALLSILLTACVSLSFMVGAQWGTMIGFLLALSTVALILGGLVVLRPLLQPPGAGETRIRALSLTSLLALSGTAGTALIARHLGWADIATLLSDEVPYPVLKRLLGRFAQIDNVPVVAILAPTIVAAAGIIILNIIWTRRPIVIPPNTLPQGAAAQTLPEADYRQAVKRYCDALTRQLDYVDQETSWSDRDLIPLEAEVEADSGTNRRSNLSRNLVKAVAGDRTTPMFLLLGEPGSGKSVSTRRLVRELCKEAPITGVLPIYVNLRELPNTPVDKLNASVLLDQSMRVARQIVGVDGRALLTGWFDYLRSRGRLFFVFDSFDEHPVVLRTDNTTDEHRALSRMLYDLVSGEISPCRALIASREFKQPVIQSARKLHIRPFRDKHILKCLRHRFLGHHMRCDDYLAGIYAVRYDLLPLVRNPFTLQLLAEYAVRNATRYPKSVYDLFDSYVEARIRDELESSPEHGLVNVDVMNAASIIAVGLFERDDASLEVTVDGAREFVGAHLFKIDAIMHVLKNSKLIRLGVGDKASFAFSHRRFAEFFAARQFKVTGNAPALSAITNNSVWRDCLILYYEISTEPDKARILIYCAAALHESLPHLLNRQLEHARPGIYALRFAVDCNVKCDFLEMVSPQFVKDITLLLRLDPSVGPSSLSPSYTVKLAAEASALLPVTMRRILTPAFFRMDCPWIAQEALDVMKREQDVDGNVLSAVATWVQALSDLDFLSRYAELQFQFALNDAWRPAKLFLFVEFVRRFALAAVAVAVVAVVVSYAHESGSRLELGMALFWPIVIYDTVRRDVDDIFSVWDKPFLAVVGAFLSLWMLTLPVSGVGRFLDFPHLINVSAIGQKIGRQDAYQFTFVVLVAALFAPLHVLWARKFASQVYSAGRWMTYIAMCIIGLAGIYIRFGVVVLAISVLNYVFGYGRIRTAALWIGVACFVVLLSGLMVSMIWQWRENTKMIRSFVKWLAAHVHDLFVFVSVPATGVMSVSELSSQLRCYWKTSSQLDYLRTVGSREIRILGKWEDLGDEFKRDVRVAAEFERLIARGEEID